MGCCDDKSKQSHAADVEDRFFLESGNGATFSREKCDKCTFKHLSYAYVAMVEAAHGYPEHIRLAQRALQRASLPVDTTPESVRATVDGKARVVGHLAHAMEECPDWRLANEIRKAYTAVLDGAERPDILTLLERLETSH